VRRCIEDRGEAPGPELPTPQITWYPLLEGEVIRSIETRTEQRQKHYGHIDLSDRPEYDSLARHRIAPPKDLTRAQTVKLVRRDSVTEDFCPCGNGKTACPRCQGRGDLPCEASTACAACRGIDSCLRCDGTGYRKLKVHEDHGVVDERVTCERCGTHNAACRTCDGRGRTTCSTCHGAGVRDCPDCDRAGTVPHQRCKGAGRIVTWIEGIIRREPRTERIRQPETGVPYPAWSAARESGAWHQLHLTGQDPLPADAASRFLHLVQPHLTPHEGEIARQATFRHLRLARTVVPQHPHRVYYVLPTAASPRVLVLPSRRRTWQIAVVALVALLALVLLLRLFS
jgi:hypothetical protein